MIINTGSRTDIPAFFSPWFFNRLHAGWVCVRNPYNPGQVTRYRLEPDVVDAIVFCTKNPTPMLERLGEIDAFGQIWHVTITPYGREIEPFVPPWEAMAESLLCLSEKLGSDAVAWRCDPIFLTEKYTEDVHLRFFDTMCRRLAGACSQVVVSFIDLYQKTKKNFAGICAVPMAAQRRMIRAMDAIAGEYHMQIHLCCESSSLAGAHTDAGGCLSKDAVEHAIGWPLSVPSRRPARKECSCLLGADIGVYNTCGHGCRYCYANYDARLVQRNLRMHDPASPFLLGHARLGDHVHDAVQTSWKEMQLKLF